MEFGLREMNEGSIYLRNTLVFGKQKSKEFMRLKDRARMRLEGWKSQLLSKAGKATLIRSVIQAILVYTMSNFKVPKGMCKEMNASVRKFWWGGRKDNNRLFALKKWVSSAN